MTPDELVAKWMPVLMDAEEIWSWTEPHALAYCAEQASKGTIAVELGTYLGKSAFVMLKANPNLHLWCVDTFNEIGIQKTAEYWLKPFIREDRCELIKGDSNRAREMLNYMSGHIDAVWVDDGHSEDDLVRDINAMLPLLKPGGVLFGHDWDGNNDVARGVKRTGIQVEIQVPRVWTHVKGWPINPPQQKASCCGR